MSLVCKRKEAKPNLASIFTLILWNIKGDKLELQSLTHFYKFLDCTIIDFFVSIGCKISADYIISNSRMLSILDISHVLIKSRKSELDNFSNKWSVIFGKYYRKIYWILSRSKSSSILKDRLLSWFSLYLRYLKMFLMGSHQADKYWNIVKQSHNYFCYWNHLRKRFQNCQSMH